MGVSLGSMSLIFLRPRPSNKNFFSQWKYTLKGLHNKTFYYSLINRSTLIVGFDADKTLIASLCIEFVAMKLKNSIHSAALGTECLHLRIYVLQYTSVIFLLDKTNTKEELLWWKQHERGSITFQCVTLACQQYRQYAYPPHCISRSKISKLHCNKPFLNQINLLFKV
jgi:hypothetical protein